MKNDDHGILRIDLVGKDPELFNTLFSKLQEAIINIVEKLSDKEVNPSTRTAMDEVISVAQTYIEAKLKEPSLKNEKLLADITKTYAEAEEALARTRKENAVTEQIELDNLKKKLELAMWMMNTIEVKASEPKTVYLATSQGGEHQAPNSGE